MRTRTRRWIQVLLVAAFAVAGARLLWILFERRQPGRPAATAGKLNPDYYVLPPKAYLTDLKSAKAMKGRTLWVRIGWRYSSQPYDAARRRNTARGAALLGPLEKITVADVVAEPSRVPGVRQVDLIFNDPAATPPLLRAVAVGVCEGPDCRFYLDAMFFLKDPHELYSHWTPEVWKVIEKHQVREGMTETQVACALGAGRYLERESRAAGDNQRVYEFLPPGQDGVIVTFDKDGYARRIERAVKAKPVAAPLGKPAKEG